MGIKEDRNDRINRNDAASCDVRIGGAGGIPQTEAERQSEGTCDHLRGLPDIRRDDVQARRRIYLPGLQEEEETKMTTKKPIKELMAFGVSRNRARKMARMVRRDGISNADAYYGFCDKYIECVERMLGVFGGDRA